MKLESKFQSDLIKKIKKIFPGCIVLKNDADYLQGVPDLTVYYGPKYAMLECKRSEHEHRRPNQTYYVNYVNNMAYSSFVYPDNEQQVLDELIDYFKDCRGLMLKILHHMSKEKHNL